MSLLATFGVLVAGVVGLTPLSERIRVPQPIVLTVFGVLLALVPGMPALAIPPQLILPVVLPPLLFAATQRTTVREFRDSARPVVLLAVGLTTATAAVVAAVGHLAGLEWGVAWVLGAIVSPPDPVAATAVARRLHLPHRLVTVLEGEGMFNDATALVIYQVVVAAVVTGRWSTGQVGLEVVLAIGVGVGLGVALGWATTKLLSVVHDGPSETAVTAAMPFVAYLAADHFRGSGVLAVLALGLFLRSFGHRATSSSGYVLGRSVWRFADFVITSLVFALIGFELSALLRRSALGGQSLTVAAAVVGAVIVVRAIWLYPAAWLARFWARRRDVEAPYGWRETTVTAWAGMRGVVTVATTLALPMTVAGGAAFPARADITLAALVCVLVTLLGQGLTLAPLVAKLGVGRDHDLPGEIARLRRDAANQALRALGNADDVPAPIRAAAIEQYEGYLAAQASLDRARQYERDDDMASGELRRALQLAGDVERDVVLAARRAGRVSVAAADRVLDEVEARAARNFD
jgi:CPA1 family monovalent cation:H+ antiporter